jgi:hypothetical protein
VESGDDMGMSVGKVTERLIGADGEYSEGWLVRIRYSGLNDGGEIGRDLLNGEGSQRKRGEIRETE